MKIEREFEYYPDHESLADEFCANDSEYQADVINRIGLQFKIWSRDKKRPATYIQLLEIAELLNEKGEWFIKTLYDYVKDKNESED